MTPTSQQRSERLATGRDLTPQPPPWFGNPEPEPGFRCRSPHRRGGARAKLVARGQRCHRSPAGATCNAATTLPKAPLPVGEGFGVRSRQLPRDTTPGPGSPSLKGRGSGGEVAPLLLVERGASCRHHRRDLGAPDARANLRRQPLQRQRSLGGIADALRVLRIEPIKERLSALTSARACSLPERLGRLRAARSGAFLPESRHSWYAPI